MNAKLLFFLGACVFALACARSNDPASKRDLMAAKNTGDIIVGAAAPWADASYMLWEGMELAAQEINAKGGLLGRPLRILKSEDGGDVSKAEIVAHQFAEDPNLVAVIGHVESYVSIPASVIYEYYGILMITPYSTDPSLTRQGFKRIFRCIPSDDVAGRMLANFAAAQGYSRMMIYYINNDYGNSLANAFEKQAQESGIAIVDRLAYDSSSGQRQFKTDCTSWKNDYEFDAIFLAGEVPQAALFIKEARDLGISVPVVGGDGMDSPQLVEVAGPASEGTFIGSTFHPEDPRPEVQGFVKAFQARYGKPPDGAAGQGYDTLQALAHAIRHGNTTVPVQVAAALKSMPPFEGVTGQIAFDKNGNLFRDSILIKTVKNGQLICYK